MAEEKINQQNEDTSPTLDDVIASWDTSSGVQKKASLSSVKTLFLYYPYKFRATRAAAHTTGAATFTKFPWDTEQYDTNSNFDSTTNRRYVPPVNGFYSFDVSISMINPGADFIIALYVAGTEASRLFHSGGTITMTGSGSDTLQLTATTDYVEVFVYCTNGASADVAAFQNHFSGRLMSLT